MNNAHRDLSCPDLWADSLSRSRTRRAVPPARRELPAFGPRGATVAATLAIACTSVGVAALGPAATTDSAEAAKVRSRGAGVADLQRKLGLPADGVYGPQTKRAVKSWQKRHGLTADGIAGPTTRSKMKLGSGAVLKVQQSKPRRARTRRASRSTGTRQSGGSGVRGLQRKLGLPADGSFGPQTALAVKRWQRSHGLTADGVVGPATRSKLGMGPGKVLKRKSSGGGSSNSSGSPSVVSRAIAAGNRIATKPYKWGGGHGSFEDSGYDCSGSVSYVLHAAGLLKTSRASGGFTSYGEPGPGRVISIYANSGHMFMTINGRRFDTSAVRETGSRWSNSMRSTSGYVVRHPAGW